MSPASRYRRRKLRMNAKLTLMSGARGAGASVPEHEASKEVLFFGLPDGTKGFTAVFDLGRWG